MTRGKKRPTLAEMLGIRQVAETMRRTFVVQTTLRHYLGKHRHKFAGAISLSVLYAGMRLLEPWPLQILLDNVVLKKHTKIFGVNPLKLLHGDQTMLVALASISILVIAGVSGLIYYVQSITIAGIGQKVVVDLRRDVFSKMQRLSLPFHQRSSTGDLLMRLTSDMIMLRDMILSSLITLMTQFLLLISVVALMMTVSMKLSLIAIALAPILAILFRTFRRKMVETARMQRRREGSLAASLEDVLVSVPMIQAYTAENREDERFRELSKRSAKAGLKAARLEAGMQRLVEVTVALGTCLVTWFGIVEVVKGRLTPGHLLVFLSYLRMVYRPVRGISKITERTARASAAAERVLEILSAKTEIHDEPGAIPAPPLRGEIAFEHVSFTYHDGTIALRDIDLRIRPGECVALVGPTGAGKSTLIALLLRFYDPSQGRVTIDGVDLRGYTLESLRKQTALLPQDPFVLAMSIRENLLYGKETASDQELWTALRAASLEEYVQGLPGGLDSPIMQRGASLSGGQRQRIAIARAMLKDAPILLFDEPTTGLDARSESDVLESFERLRSGRTTLMIAHRFATLRSADRVLVLNEGRLVEDGSPDRLMSQDTLFRFLAEIQGFGPTMQSPTLLPGPIRVRP